MCLRQASKGDGDEQSADRSPDKTAESQQQLLWWEKFYLTELAASKNMALHRTSKLSSFSFTSTLWPVNHCSSKTCQMLPLAWSRAEASGHINNSSGWGFRRCQTSHGPGPPLTETTRRQMRPFEAILATLPSSVSSVLFLLFPVLFMLFPG